jgi:hypothetical protein
MKKRMKGGCCGQKGSGRKKKLHAWARRGRQKGGFLFTGMALIGSAIWAGVTAAAPAVAAGALTAAAGYGTTKALEAVGGKTGSGRRKRSRRIRRR